MIALVLWLEETGHRWRGNPAEPKQLPLRREDQPQ
jgi:hypothetical protein